MARKYQIGCDIGGTFTDMAVVDDRGRVVVDKADTTPHDLSEGVVAALRNVAGRLGIEPGELLATTTRFVNGTTSVTNAVVQLRGSTVGLLITRGFGDSLRIARSARNGEKDHHLQLNVPDLVRRDLICEVDERVDRHGDVVVALDQAAARAAIDGLVERGAESLAICLLWSFANDEHERTLARLAREMYPDLYVSTSSEVLPMIREYERMITTILNSFTGPPVDEYTGRIERRLGEMGLGTPISFMQCFGGTVDAEEARARPITLIDSGPVGGVVGANELGLQLGIPDLIAADMGGTSFDVSVINDNRYRTTQRVMLREFLTGLSKIDVISVGAGGGSIAWTDARGQPKVGPASAGADPGPAAYARGGDLPTVTDASVVLGLIDPDKFLGGRRRLDRDEARRVIARDIAEPLEMSVEEAAAAIHRLTVAAMSRAVHRVTVEGGRDPRSFTMVAFGGALPLFAADICRRMGIRRAIVPAHSAVASAAGLLATDDVRHRSRSVFWSEGSPVDDLNAEFEALEADAVGSLRRAGFGEDQIEAERQGDFKFEGQLFELTVPMPAEELRAEHLEDIRRRFPGIYEEEFGAGTAWIESPIRLLAIRVVAKGRVERPPVSPPERPAAAAGAPAKAVSTRPVHLPGHGGTAELPVYDADDLATGATIEGPAIVEARITTLLVPADWALGVDPFGNFVLEDRVSEAGEGREQRAAVA
ncbi:MAG TPA: hydantoinase/oxoprolinase family protein [Solirubrobacterales bacterium]|nr:hydantoinase/oxoprolinase family protein [Solirubrobacterales bacterium]